jgi:hypothetical protein
LQLECLALPWVKGDLARDLLRDLLPRAKFLPRGHPKSIRLRLSARLLCFPAVCWLFVESGDSVKPPVSGTN